MQDLVFKTELQLSKKKKSFNQNELSSYEDTTASDHLSPYPTTTYTPSMLVR